MATPLTRGHKPRTAGITESRLSAFTGINEKHFTIVSSGGSTAQTQATSVLYDHTMQVATTDWVKVDHSTVATLTGTWLSGKLLFPATPCITLVFATTGLAHRMRLRIRGKSQFGADFVDELPEMTLSSTITGVPIATGFVRIWFPTVFSEITSIEYQFPDAIGVAPHMHAGLFFTWNPVLEQSLFDNTGTIGVDYRATFYVFPQAQGIGTQMEVGALVGSAPNFYPEVVSLCMHTTTPGVTTLANVPPIGGIANSGGFAVGDAYVGTDLVSGVPYRLLTPEPNKIRISAVPVATPIKCLDRTTNLGGQADGSLYIPADLTGGAEAPEIPLTLYYHVHVRPAYRKALRLGGPLIAP